MKRNKNFKEKILLDISKLKEYSGWNKPQLNDKEILEWKPIWRAKVDQRRN